MIRAGSGKVVRLQWLSFALEPHPPSCRFDSVSVFDNGTFPSSGNLIGRYCGTALPPMVTTTGDTMTVVFQSDSAVAAAGFTASYVTLNSSSCKYIIRLFVNFRFKFSALFLSLRWNLLHRDWFDLISSLPVEISTFPRLQLDHSGSLQPSSTIKHY